MSRSFWIITVTIISLFAGLLTNFYYQENKSSTVSDVLPANVIVTYTPTPSITPTVLQEIKIAQPTFFESTPIPSPTLYPTVTPNLNVKCPTGEGEGLFIYESKKACEERWEKKKQQFFELVDQNAQAREKFYDEWQRKQEQISNLEEQTRQLEVESIVRSITPGDYTVDIDFKIIVPTPTPCPTTLTGEIIDWPNSPCGNP